MLLRLTGLHRSQFCILISISLFSGCSTTTADLRNTYRSKALHKAFLICEGGNSAAAWGASTSDEAITVANRTANSNFYRDCVLEDVDGKSGADYLFQQYMSKPDNKVFLQCSGRSFSIWGKANLDDAIQAIASRAQTSGFSDCVITNTNGDAVEKVSEDKEGEQPVFERPPDV